MSETEKKETVETEKKEATPAEAPVTKQKAAPETVQSKQVTESPKAEPKKEHRLTDDGDDDIPEEAELVSLSTAAFKKRMQRYSSKQLKDAFGTSDVNEIKAKLEKATKLEAQEEERKRAQMSEVEKYQADLKKERTRRREAERRERLTNQERLAEKGEMRVTRAADAAGVDSDFHDALFPKFKKHLLSLSAQERAAMKDSEIKKWFAEQLKQKPKYARDYVPTKEPLQTTSKKEGLPEKEDKSGGENVGEPNFSPTSKNAMSPTQARAAARQRGYSWT